MSTIIQGPKGSEETATPEISLQDSLLNAEQVSTDFFCSHVSYWTVLDMAKQGDLPCILIGRRPYFTLDSLINWRNEQLALPYWQKRNRKKTKPIKH